MNNIKIILKYGIATFAIASILSGCTTQPKERHFQYVNDEIDDKIAYRESKIQLSKCIIEINKIISAPMPIICDEKDKEICEKNKEKKLKSFEQEKELKLDNCMKNKGYRKSYFNW